MAYDRAKFLQGMKEFNARARAALSGKEAAASSDDSQANSPADGQDATEQQARATWRTNAAIREEFLTEGTYVAYCRAVASGQVRIQTPAPGLSRHTRAPELSGS